MTGNTDAAFEDFVTSALPWLQRLGYAWTHDWHRAADLAQGALERVYAVWWRVSSRGDPWSYTRTVMLRLMISEDRKRPRRREEVSIAQEYHEPAIPSEDTEGRLDLMAAIARLPQRQRMVVLLRFVEDLPVTEVAGILHCSPGTVKSQTHHALVTLRGCLAESHRPTTVRPGGSGE